MNCADCGNSKLAIYDTRHIGQYVVRKRKCLGCDERFFTIESYMTEEELADVEAIKQELSHEVRSVRRREQAVPEVLGQARGTEVLAGGVEVDSESQPQSAEANG